MISYNISKEKEIRDKFHSFIAKNQFEPNTLFISKMEFKDICFECATERGNPNPYLKVTNIDGMNVVVVDKEDEYLEVGLV